MQGSETLGDTAGQRALSKYLSWIDDGAMPSDEVLRALYSKFVNFEAAREVFAARVPDLQGAVLVDVEEAHPRSTAILSTVAKGRWRVSAVVDDEGRISGVAGYRDPDGVMIRQALASDGERLAELCRAVPIVTPGRKTWLDYGDDYLVATALCEARDVFVAELDGVIVGLQGIAYRRVRVAGADCVAGYLRHTRVAPAAQGAGVFSALNGRSFETGRARADWSYSIVASGNDGMLRNLPSSLPRWAIHRRFHLPCAPIAGRPAAGEHVADLDETVAALTHAHGEDVLFPPFDRQRLKARLATTPYYGADCVLANDGAILGVSRHTIRTTIEQEGRPAYTEVQATAIDAGCPAERVDAFLQLVHSWCARLSDNGVTHLAIAANQGTALHEALVPLATDWTDYVVNLGVPAPGDSPQPPAVYIDQALV